MEVEHGIIFNKPYVKTNYNAFNPFVVKEKTRMTGHSSPYTGDNSEILIPISVIDDGVFCVAMILRTSTTPTEYEAIAPSYPGGMPTTNSFYWQENERLAYFSVISIKDFIEHWKIKG